MSTWHAHCFSVTCTRASTLLLSKVTPAPNFALANSLKDPSAGSPVDHPKAILRFLVASGIEMISIAKCEPCTFRDALRRRAAITIKASAFTRHLTHLSARQRSRRSVCLDFAYRALSIHGPSAFTPRNEGLGTAQTFPGHHLPSTINRLRTLMDHHKWEAHRVQCEDLPER
jgi:hypothetical protein